jgi:hypothetical protein
MSLTQEQYEALRAPFPPEEIEWKPGHLTGDKKRALALAYADSRLYQERLDQVAGNWSDSYELLDNGRVVICRLTVGDLTRCDVGESEVQDKNTVTSAAAQAFKRAAVKFGVGRYLYNVPQTWVDYDERKKRIVDSELPKLQRMLVNLFGGEYADPKQTPSEPDSEPELTEHPLEAATSIKITDDPFESPQQAIAWAMNQGVFNAKQHAENAYDKCKRDTNPKSAGEMAKNWRLDVAARIMAK